MLKIFLLIFSSVVLVATLQWRDCGDSKKAVTISQFDAPTHLNFPGLIHYTLDLTFNRNIDYVYVDFDVIRYFLGFPISLPCNPHSVVGTCNEVDLCNLFELTLKYIPNRPEYYGQQLQTMMNDTLGHYLQCPIQAANIFAKDHVLQLAEIPSYLHVLADGDYTIKIYARENKTEPAIGCIEVNVTIGGQDNFGPASLLG